MVILKNLMYGFCRLMVLLIFVGNVMFYLWLIESKKVNLMKLLFIFCLGNFIVDDLVLGISFFDYFVVLIFFLKFW